MAGQRSCRAEDTLFSEDRGTNSPPEVLQQTCPVLFSSVSGGTARESEDE